MPQSLSWPDYCKRETLAKRLNIAAGAVDQLVKRGLLPQPIKVGEALLWRWESVDSFLQHSQSESTLMDATDPYLAGALHCREAAPARKTDS